MSSLFFDKPILNSPYELPGRHWELDSAGQPTQKIIESRRQAKFISPIPKPRYQKAKQQTNELELYVDETGAAISTESQKFDQTDFINTVRRSVDEWRALPNPLDWKVTAETARLLQHWRHYHFNGIRPFFCQVEAIETLIWLTEVAPKSGKHGGQILDYLKNANLDANPELFRIALKMATGAGKTTVMAMIIAWQTINAVRHPQSKNWTRGFLVVSPGITIRDRLRVLRPGDPNSNYADRELVPADMLPDLKKAKVVITNYHAFMLRDTLNLSKGTRSFLQGHGEKLNTLETEGQMIKRVMPELMGFKNIVIINDEAHHCYRAKPGGENTEEHLSGDAKDEAKENNEAARVWISGLEMVKRCLGLGNVFDLSATPFFLQGSGYPEGTLFHWTASDFSLMDAIECGIVKLPRVPVSDNIPGSEMPLYRNLWEHIGKEMPKKGREKSGSLNPALLPVKLQTALEALYGHYEKTFESWQEANISAPPCFIIVCNNTASSKLVYDFISGYYKETPEGKKVFNNGRFPLFRNFDDNGNPLGRPRTLLIDSRQLESGEALDDNFRTAARVEIEYFRNERIARGKTRQEADDMSDADLLREVMNTVGKAGRLGDSIRCVVSVSMLTEGWDANTVTHVLGVRAFGTQLLCEQVIGRALRRQSYELNEDNRFNVEYADVLGIPFDFTGDAQIVKPAPPQETINVHACSPERDSLEIRFPRVAGYCAELPEEKLTAAFTADSKYLLTPDVVGPTKAHNSGIIGEGVDLDVRHLDTVRTATIIYNLTRHLLQTKFADDNGEIKLHLFGQLKNITQTWFDNYLECTGGVKPAMLLYQVLADEACNKIVSAITKAAHSEQGKPIKALLDPYNPEGSTAHVNFNTSKAKRWETDSRKCHINYVICDSDWEKQFAQCVEGNKHVIAYVKNQSLGFEIPYQFEGGNHKYIPDFIVLLNDRHDAENPLHLIVEIKGIRGNDARAKKATIENYWLPAINRLQRYGRWAFAEFTDPWAMEEEFGKAAEGYCGGGK
jgi:type III restriction enzyme